VKGGGVREVKRPEVGGGERGGKRKLAEKKWSRAENKLGNMGAGELSEDWSGTGNNRK